MKKQSAGILVFRIRNQAIECCLGHPGGPFYLRKDDGVWTIFKGEFLENEDPLMAAKREFQEETGLSVSGKFIKLEPVKMKTGKMIYGWAVETDFSVENITSNTFPLEWPPHSGTLKQFPEIDRAAWFGLKDAAKKIHPAQLPLLHQLIAFKAGPSAALDS